MVRSAGQNATSSQTRSRKEHRSKVTTLKRNKLIKNDVKMPSRGAENEGAGNAKSEEAYRNVQFLRRPNCLPRLTA